MLRCSKLLEILLFLVIFSAAIQWLVPPVASSSASSSIVPPEVREIASFVFFSF